MKLNIRTLSVVSATVLCGIVAITPRSSVAADTVVEYQFDVVAGFEASGVSGVLFDDITTSTVAQGSYFNVGNIEGNITIPTGAPVTMTTDGVAIENLHLSLGNIEGDYLEFSFDSSDPQVPQAFNYFVGPNGIGNWVATTPDRESTLLLSLFSMFALTAAARRFNGVGLNIHN